MSISFKMNPHTVYLLCGPTMCGKSTFAEGIAGVADKLGYSVAVLSSDFRRERLRAMSRILLSGSDLPEEEDDIRHSSGMMAASRQAFDLLFAELKVLASYPINTEVIVVDTTGFDETFRKDVTNIAKNNSYRVELITFEYKTRAEYFQKDASQDQTFIVGKSLDKFRKAILPNLLAKDYDARIRVKDRNSWEADFADMANTMSESTWDYRRNFTKSDLFAVVGDSHECVEELQQMVEKLETDYPGIQIVHVGDYLDKGGNTKAMVDFMHDRVVNGLDLLVKGNHESYVQKRFGGEITKIDYTMEEENFSSVKFFESEPASLAKFKEIDSLARDFLVVGKLDDTSVMPVVITHAPCHDRYIGKMSSYALREQRNYRSKDRTQSWFKELDWYYKEAEFIFPTHVVGHVAHKVTTRSGHKFKNKIFIDTGCVYGNSLSAAVFKNCQLVEIVEVKSSRPMRAEKLEENLGFPPKEKKAFNIADYELETKDLRLLRQIEANGVRYISGTMSPAPSTNESLESLQSAFDFYQKKGVTELTLQPKYMGSRCQTYLFKDETKETFQVSRNGWKIRKVDGKTEEEYAAFKKSLRKDYDYLFEYWGATEVILDGELLPWRALGSGLIDGPFISYQELVRDEIDTLADDDGLKALQEFCLKLDIDGKVRDLLLFEKSLANFTKDTPTEFRAFDILYADGEAGKLVKSTDKFPLVNSDIVSYVNLETCVGLENAFRFFDKLTMEQGMEGVVVKPVTPTKGVPPYMKVRSPEYLRIVYGYDYPSRLERLCRQKNISGKVATSIREYEAATEMLTAEGDRKTELIVKLIGDIKTEKFLDPRL